MHHHPAPDGFWHLVRAARDLRLAVRRVDPAPGDEGLRLALRALGAALERIESQAPADEIVGVAAVG